MGILYNKRTGFSINAGYTSHASLKRKMKNHLRRHIIILKGNIVAFFKFSPFHGLNFLKTIAVWGIYRVRPLGFVAIIIERVISLVVAGDIRVAKTVSIGIKVTKAIAKCVDLIVTAEDKQYVKYQ